MNIDNRFASRATSVDETPEPFRRELRKHLKPNEPVSFLAYAPVYASLGETSPATLLAITSQRWLIVAEGENGDVEVSNASFDETLVIELTEIFLFGQLKIDFILNGQPRSGAVQFNTVMEKLYREAVQLVLDGIEHVSPRLNEKDGHEIQSLSEWPLKFQNDVLISVPKGRHLLLATHWPALVGGFHGELAPATVLALTEREIVVVTEEKAWEWFQPRKPQKYGRIVTYFPLARLARHHISRHEHFNLLELETYTIHGGEKLPIMFPPPHEPEIVKFMDRAWPNKMPA